MIKFNNGSNTNRNDNIMINTYYYQQNKYQNNKK